ncbi:MAG TPA: molecular chaperone TorD family protein [Burkholderiales bacterium]
MLTASAISACPTSPPGSAASAKAEFYICLSRAFRPLATARARASFARELPEDLAALADEAGYALGPLVERFAAAAREAEGSLLQGYSGLFLVPPVKVPLNAGLYLDGGLLGRATQAMLERYAQAGLAPDESFRDLPDHVAMQLEYVATMFARAAEGDAASEARAGEFLETLVLPWIPAFAGALQAASAQVHAARAYGALAAILEAAARLEASRRSPPD